MSLEIRELIIKATIVPDGTATTGSSTSGNNNTSPNEELINICVEKILEIIKERESTNQPTNSN